MQCKFNYMEATQSTTVVFVCVLSGHSLNFIDEKSWTDYRKSVEPNYLSSTEISNVLLAKYYYHNNFESMINH